MSSNEEDNAANNSLSDTQPSVPEITDDFVAKCAIKDDQNDTKRPSDPAQVPQTGDATQVKSLIRIFTDWLGWMDCCRKFIKKEWLEEKMKILDNLVKKANEIWNDEPIDELIEIWNDGLLGFRKKEWSLTTKDSLYSNIYSLEQLYNDINEQKLKPKVGQSQNQNINDFLEQYKILVDSCERQKSEARSDLIVFEFGKTYFEYIKAKRNRFFANVVEELTVDVNTKYDSCIDELSTIFDVNPTHVNFLQGEVLKIKEENEILFGVLKELKNNNQTVSNYNPMKKETPIYQHMLWNITGFPLNPKDTQSMKNAEETLETLKKFINLYEVDVVTLIEMRITDFVKFQEIFGKVFDGDKFGILSDKSFPETEKWEQAQLIMIYRKHEAGQQRPEICNSWRIRSFKKQKYPLEDRILRYEYKGVLYFAVHLNAHKQGNKEEKETFAENTKEKLIEGKIKDHQQVVLYGDPNLEDVFKKLNAKKLSEIEIDLRFYQQWLENLKPKEDPKEQNKEKDYEAVFDKLRLVKQWIEKTTNTKDGKKTRPDAVVTRLDEQGQPLGVQLLNPPFVEERCMYRNGESMSTHHPIFFNVLPVPGYFQKAYDEILASFVEEATESASQGEAMTRPAKDDASQKEAAARTSEKDSDAPETSK